MKTTSFVCSLQYAIYGDSKYETFSSFKKLHQTQNTNSRGGNDVGNSGVVDNGRNLISSNGSLIHHSDVLIGERLFAEHFTGNQQNRQLLTDKHMTGEVVVGSPSFICSLGQVRNWNLNGSRLE